MIQLLFAYNDNFELTKLR